MGAEFRIKVLPNQRAEIVVMSPMADEYAEQLPTYDNEPVLVRPQEVRAFQPTTRAGAPATS